MSQRSLSPAQLKEILSLIDLTFLSKEAVKADIFDLVRQSHTDYGDVAALCVYPEHLAWVKEAQDLLGTSGEKHKIRCCTVINFPGGDFTLPQVLKELEFALDQGADEIDLVIPYSDLINGNEVATCEMVSAVRSLMPSTSPLKCILETGELKTPLLIELASELSLESGCNFLKTSTGKVPVNATLEAAAIMLDEIRFFKKEHPTRQLGFKASGGVRSPQEALAYLDLAREMLGGPWPTPKTFRFGASGLLSSIILQLQGDDIDPVSVKDLY